MTHAPRILCAHLLDDFSGSAKVFAQSISELKRAGAEVEVLVGSAGQSGFIRATHGARIFPYRYSERRLPLLLRFVTAQFLLFLGVTYACLVRRIDIVYANTVLTPGAVIAGWLCRRRVVVHLHEVGLGSRTLFRVLLAIVRSLADRHICVSEYMRDALDFSDRTMVVHNSLAKAEWQRAEEICAARHTGHDGVFVVMMVCSLKWYKGLDSFLALAHKLSLRAAGRDAIQCRLVLNCDPHEWRVFAAQNEVPANVSVVLRPADVYQHYAEASLVLNLSHPEGWLETFGMTLLEAMACGVPVIGPMVGGCTELFADGQGGWRIGSRDIDAMVRRVHELAADRQLWLDHSRAAQINSRKFSLERFSSGLHSALMAWPDWPLR